MYSWDTGQLFLFCHLISLFQHGPISMLIEQDICGELLSIQGATAPARSIVCIPFPIIFRNLWKRTKWSLPDNSSCLTVVGKFRCNDAVWGGAILDPSHKSQQCIVVCVLEAGHRGAGGTELLILATKHPRSIVLGICTMAHAGNEKKPVEIIQALTLRYQRLFDFLVEISAGTGGYETVGLSVVMDQFSTLRFEWRNVEIVRRGISWVYRVRQLHGCI